MATRTVYIVLETHWWYDDQDWSVHIPDKPMKAYATHELAQQQMAHRRQEPDFDDETGLETRYAVVEVEIEDVG